MEEKGQVNLRKLLAVAVRSIQWSYAMFWSLSTKQHGVLEWIDGYYNGDIKTRKTAQAVELKADKIGLQRSEQLRELYEFLLEGEIDQQTKRPSAALSPEDLSDAEWYYLVCMSFVFNPGEGLPGRALVNRETIWLCNAHQADSKVFSRSLLAKGASIQTVVCFPHLGGVIELGVTDLVPEDPNLLQHIKASLLNFSKPICSEKSSSSPHNEDDDDKEPMCTEVDHEIENTLASENINTSHGSTNDEFKIESPESSNGRERIHQMEDSLMIECINGGASQVESRHFMDNDFSNCVQDSINSSDRLSEDFFNQEKAFSSSKCEKVCHLHSKEVESGNHTKLNSLDLGTVDDLPYRRTLSTILNCSNQLIESLCLRRCDYKSNFMSWNKERMIDGHKSWVQQNMLKKILFAEPLMHGGSTIRSHDKDRGKDCPNKLDSHDIFTGHVLSDKSKENEKFLVLRSMAPSINEIDKAAILNDTIKYLKELEARVEELESCMDSVDFEATPKRSVQDMVERTSDNYDNMKIDGGKKPWINKRKAWDIDETDLELNGVEQKDGLPSDVQVSMKEKDVIIEMRCPYREYILLDIIDAMNSLNLDAHTVQSSTLDGILMLILKSKFREPAIAPVGMIKHALWRIAGKR